MALRVWGSLVNSSMLDSSTERNTQQTNRLREVLWFFPSKNGLKQVHCCCAETVDLHLPAMEGSTAKKVSSCKLISEAFTTVWVTGQCLVCWPSVTGLVEFRSGFDFNLREVTDKAYFDFYTMSNGPYFPLHMINNIDRLDTGYFHWDNQPITIPIYLIMCCH